MSDDKKIYVTQPYLPPLEDFIPSLQKIWKSKQLTNSGPFHREFEERIAEYLGVPFVSLVANGTIGLIIALKALDITGEVITTPYSFVATSHALLWNNIEPVFVDIQRDTFNIDPLKIEQAITSKTTAILPVHCYGNPCDVDAIECVSERYNLKVLYDAAHAFGVKRGSQNVLAFGDISVVSFHATKIFNTLEGGLIVSRDYETKQYVDFLKNFGFKNELTVLATGINGKMNEVQAALGLLQLEHINDLIEKNKAIDARYRAALTRKSGIKCLHLPGDIKWNYSYFPVLVEPEYLCGRDELYEILKESNIYARRYFYPLISEFPMYKQLASANKENLKTAVLLSEQILCLPIYPDLSEEDQNIVIDIILSSG